MQVGLKLSMFQQYGNEIVAYICSIVAAHIFGFRAFQVTDSIQHVVYSLDHATIEFLKFVATTISGIAGGALSLWLKDYFERRKEKRDHKYRKPK